ncbi:MAG: hypothetical protein SOZ62_04740 [Eubacteriales bacterium]|nr:hypothetical protein [Eubacteriales bacterium]
MKEENKTEMPKTTELFEILSYLISVPTVSGLESVYQPVIVSKLSSLCEPFGIEIIRKNNGNIILHKHCGVSDIDSSKSAKKLLIDTHVDQIGLSVTEICEGGFIRASAIGGIDARTLAAGDVIIIGKERVSAVVASVPPHLRSGDEESLSSTDNILIDTGLSYEEACSLISVGDAVVFENSISTLANGCISASSLDNKISAACAILALISSKNVAYDTYVLLSSREESGAFSGMRTGIYSVLPDYIITIDVNFARAPVVKRRESIQRGGGPSVSFSALTDRNTTDKVISLAKNNSIPLSVVVEADNLGTNANAAALVGYGAYIVNMSLPLTNMHSTHESASLIDAERLSRLLTLIIEGGLE